MNINIFYTTLYNTNFKFKKESEFYENYKINKKIILKDLYQLNIINQQDMIQLIMLNI